MAALASSLAGPGSDGFDGAVDDSALAVGVAVRAATQDSDP